MRIKVNKDVCIYTIDNCFVLSHKEEEFYYKSFDLLLSKLTNVIASDEKITSIEELVNTMKELRDMIHGLYAVSGIYPEIKFKTKKYTGVNYGTQC